MRFDIILLNNILYVCRNDNVYGGALAYADDVILLAPTRLAMRSLLQICEQYDREFYIVVNAEKSACLIISKNGWL